MPNWVDVASEAACPEGSALEVVAAGRMVALYHTSDGMFATDGMCAHQGGPLGQGQLCGKIVTCPWHGWQYDVTTGKHELSSIHLDCFEVKVEAGRIWVDVTE
ncbi:non-heme iron oxygenase ferredoxin subunit [Bremerella cremea]|uniref:Ferredoxin n=1 Tax=Blastopirellula marina TaxID=124 RepID=A0A2S8FZW8_9BACT|nr:MULTISPECIES: Rieske 2Fe-2S domain-containing protein [Pirellulaceae]PQO37723.1 ferredoxin [Blastopirellula marina]RCS50110.1 non-heme iron oxygenase ferredoxin subunit [Bremerella cremea]